MTFELGSILSNLKCNGGRGDGVPQNRQWRQRLSSVQVSNPKQR